MRKPNDFQVVGIASFFAATVFLFSYMNCCAGLIDVVYLFGGFIFLLFFPMYVIWVYGRWMVMKPNG